MLGERRGKMVPIRIVLVADHPFFRMGLRAVIAPNAALEIVGEAASPQMALAVIELARPDVVILDLSLVDGEGLATAKDMFRNGDGPRVLILTVNDSAERMRRCLVAGVTGYALKTDSVDIVLDAIEAVAQGQVYVSPNVPMGAVDDEMEPDSGVNRLTARERQVFDLVVQGYSTKKIAARFGLSSKTVDSHRSRINDKLDVHSPGEIIRLAAKHGFLFAKSA